MRSSRTSFRARGLSDLELVAGPGHDPGDFMVMSRASRHCSIPASWSEWTESNSHLVVPNHGLDLPATLGKITVVTVSRNMRQPGLTSYLFIADGSCVPAS